MLLLVNINNKKFNDQFINQFIFKKINVIINL